MVLLGMMVAMSKNDDTQQRDWSDKISDAITRWTINIVQVIVAIVVLSGLMQLGFFYLDTDDYYDIFGHTWVSETLARCDSLAEELTADQRCMNSSDCTLTRDELVAHEKGIAKYALHCARE